MYLVLPRDSMKKRNNVYGVRRRYLKYLLTNETPFACSLGKDNKWLCDYYSIGDIILSIGVAPTGKMLAPIIAWSFDNRAREVVRHFQIEEMDKELKDLRQEFVSMVLALKKRRRYKN